MATTNRELVQEYFNHITRKDINDLLELFDEDAVVYEPFSNTSGLFGKSAIRPFLEVVLMANEGLSRKIEFADDQADEITAHVTFRRGGMAFGRFTFGCKAVETDSRIEKKITSLRIEFLDRHP